MPRYYFDLYQGAQRISEDASGYDCPVTMMPGSSHA